MTAASDEAPRYTLVASVALSAAALAALDGPGFGPFDVVLARLQLPPPCAATLVVVDELQPALVLAWLASGAQDVLCAADLESPALPQRLRAAIERVRLERALRLGYATDLDTGLPHQQQLIEHMSQLLALREREPAPMAVLVLRIEGLAPAEARFGRGASTALRRKVGVRLRSGVRASDVVASIGEDRFAVLLGSTLSPADAERVGAKLVQSLQKPWRVAGHDVALSAALGIGHYPPDGAQPDALLRRAIGLAAAAHAHGPARASAAAEPAGLGEPKAAPPAAANDD